MAIGFKIKNKMMARGGLTVGASGTYIGQIAHGTLDFVAGTIAAGTSTVINNTTLTGIGTADKIFGMANPANLQNGAHFTGFRIVGPGTVGAVFHPSGAAAGTVNGTVSIPYVWIKAT